MISRPVAADADALAPAMVSTVRQHLIAAVPIVAVMYNALFALLAARGVPMNVPIVIGCEILIILVALGASAMGGFRRSDTLPIGYIYFTAVMTVVMSLAQTKFAIDGLRNVLIIAGFTLLGARANERTVRIVFAVCAAVALIVLIWEIASVESYAAVFRPADYLAKTRGYGVKEFYADVGLSVGTIAYSSRFSFGIFDGPRTSTILLEQVGINCFAIVLMIYLSVMWARLTRWERWLSIVTVVLIILSNNARMASLVLPVLAAGYFAFPRLPRYINLVIPLLLLLVTVVMFQYERPRIGDDLIGRLGVTYKFLSQMEYQDLLFGNPGLLRKTFDTGYAYLIAATTIFGAIAYWMYLSLAVPQDSVAKRRAAWSMNTYIYLWLMVGGTASFSMKTASLLWFLMGFVRILPADGPDSRGRRAAPQRLLGLPVAPAGAQRGSGRRGAGRIAAR